MKTRTIGAAAAATALPGLLAGAAVLCACGQKTGESQAQEVVDAGGTGPADASAGPIDAAVDASFGIDTNPTQAPDASDAGSTPLDAAVEAETSASEPDAASTGPQSCGFMACAPGEPCPDLTVDQSDLLASVLIDTRTFAATDCAIAEGCITQTGTRRLLHFDTATQNVGNADLVVGDPTENACFQWSACHQHYHFKGVGRYTLYQSDGTTVAAVGHKQGFCLEDVEPIPSLVPPPATPSTTFMCTSQGLHVGWEDVYPNNIDCQWIDITGLPAGQYVLSVLVNGEHFLPESNYANNEARVPVTIPAQ